MAKRTIPYSREVSVYVNRSSEIAIMTDDKSIGDPFVVGLTPQQARQVAVWLVELADELEADLPTFDDDRATAPTARR